MPLSRDDARHIADLARLRFSEEELAQVHGRLGRILDYMDKLNELSTDGIAPTAHLQNQPTPLRDDEVRPPLDLGEILKNAPERQDDTIRVPRVVGGRNKSS